MSDREDAFLWGILPYAMRHKYDLICENKVTGKFLFKRIIPRLSEATVEYPETDVIIICDINNPQIIRKKLEERTKIPCYYVGDFLDLRDAF